MLAGVMMLFALTGCASIGTQSQTDYKSRVVIHQDGDVQVSASALSPQESLAVYGVALASKSIQPVWIEVENKDDVAYWLMFPGLDPNFIPASEAAEAFKTRGERRVLERRFQELAFNNPTPPGTTSRGFVLTNLDEAVKMAVSLSS